MNRLLSITSAILLATTAAQAEDKVLTVGGYGGSFQTLMEKFIIPQFEKEHKVKVQFVAEIRLRI